MAPAAHQATLLPLRLRSEASAVACARKARCCRALRDVACPGAPYRPPLARSYCFLLKRCSLTLPGPQNLSFKAVEAK